MNIISKIPICVLAGHIYICTQSYMYFDYIYGFGCIYIISVTADPLAPGKLIICSVFDVPALSEVVKVRGGKKRGEETRREDREQKNYLFIIILSKMLLHEYISKSQMGLGG